MSAIEGKRILFLSPAFFGYEKKILNKMEEMGADVDYYDEHTIVSPYLKAIWKFLPFLFVKQSDRYYEKILDACKTKDYDFVFIVRCDMISEKTLRCLKNAFPRAVFYLYLWDSFKNIPYIEKKIKYFDRCFSFDTEDVRRYPSFVFRPLFYCDEYETDKATTMDDCRYDLCFIGTIHSDRYAFIHKIEKQAAQAGKSFFVYKYLQAIFVYYFFRLTKNEFVGTHARDFEYQKMSASAVADIVDISRAVLDIQHPNQTGLTIRTLEIMGMKKKLITANKAIQGYDFFNENNILVVDRNNPQIDFHFLETPFCDIPSEIYSHYSVKSWIEEIFK